MDEYELFATEQLRLLDKEQEADINQMNELLSSLSAPDLQKRGLALTGLKVSAMKSGIGGNTIIQLESGIGGMDSLASNKFRVGDIALLEKHSGKRNAKDELKISTTITRINDTTVSVAVKQDLPDLPDLLQLTKLSNTITFKRIEYAMKWLRDLKPDTSSELVKVLFGKEPSYRDFDSVEYFDQFLNDSQKVAIEHCLSANELALIHGPPGTGKTYTCVEVIRQFAKQGKRILVCGPSNISVDNLVERLAKCKLDIVRVGHPARVLESVLQHCLDARIHNSDGGQIVNDVRQELDSTLSSLNKLKKKSDRYKVYQDLKHLRSELKTREKAVLVSTIKNAQVVLTTLNGAASKILNNEQFDVVLIDEVSQALEAECWIAIMKGKKLILAGDHLQLPPTVKSMDKVGEALSITLFDRLIALHGPKIKKMLQIQYRMNLDIMQFSSDYFYEGKLLCAPGIENRLLTDLKDVADSDETSIPIVFIDTNGHGMEEINDDEDSKLNEGEAQCVVDYVSKLVKAGVSEADIAIISPYNAQIKYLKLVLKDKYPNLELGTVDGVQGREKEVVIITLVRSNSDGQVGFLSENRRLNVALTRPKRHLCVVGDSQTLGRNRFLKKLVEYLEEKGEVRYPGM